MSSSFKRKIAKVKVSVASPDVVRIWSSGEVKKAETINYRTFKPEKEGLFCERIFGPVKDYECACGKYSGKKYEGTVCEKCGVRVESKEARRRRFGHIELAAPVTHVWYLKNTPSVIATLLDMTVKDIENIVYFGSRRVNERVVIVTDPKNTLFVKGSILNQTEYEIYAKKWDFEVSPAYIVKEPRTPLISDIDGEVHLKHERTHTDRDLTWITVKNVMRTELRLYTGMELKVKDGDFVNQGDEIVPEKHVNAIFAPFDGTVEVDQFSESVTINPLPTSKNTPITFSLPYGVRALVKNGDKVKKGQQLTTETILPRLIAPVSGTIRYSKQLNLRPLENGSYEVITTGELYIENVQHTKTYPVFEGALVYVQDGETVRAGDVLADRFLFEDEKLTAEEYKLFSQHYHGMFVVEEQIENDKPIMVITQIDSDVAQETGLTKGQIITQQDYEAYSMIYPGKIEAETGAAAIKKLLQQLDLEVMKAEIENELNNIPKSSVRAKKLLKKLKIVKDLIDSETKPEWMVLEVLPVVPPEIRPMIQIDGGRFATTDLNDLYRRVLMRNNRLRRLYEMNAPEVIVRNEKRMLQEAVDNLIFNGKIGKAYADRNGRPLKSLTDLIRGKKGRFRRNLLGKRVDYSGRAVIVVGPHLKIHECGLPKKMALELFEPFVIAELSKEENVEATQTKVKKYRKELQREDPKAWEKLEKVIQGKVVLLNRAPTLHRMSIQAFEPKLIEGNAIQLHPLVCPPFNADFDGDQMAVHLPLSPAAQAEARLLMLSRYNIISPAHGKPISMPGKDIVAGVYYLTMVGKDYDKIQPEEIKWKFASSEEAEIAYEFGYIKLHEPLLINIDGKVIKTTFGRVIFNAILPEELRDYNKTIGKNGIKDVVYKTFKTHGIDRTADLLDDIKTLGFHYATVSGLTISLKDFLISPKKDEIIGEAMKKIEEIERLYEEGLLSDDERYKETIKIWTKTTDLVQEETYKYLGENPFNPVYIMVDSGARGNKDQLKQLSGMRGLMADPSGRTIEIPIISNFREGLSVLEFFISTHGARKGSADTALRTSSAGYLTRRLVDVVQSVVVSQPDCGTHEGVRASKMKSSDNFVVEKIEDFIFGRLLAKPVYDPGTGDVLVNPETGKVYVKDTVIYDEDAKFLSNYKKRVPVAEERILDLTKVELPEVYAELAEDVDLGSETLVSETEIDWEVIKKLREANVKSVKIRLYPIVGNVVAEEIIWDKDRKRQLAVEEEQIDSNLAKLLAENNIESIVVRPEIYVRSPLTCESEHGICAKCYGLDLSNHKVVNVGESVGIIAAQSIGEPGTQLTMRTFHTGGIATTADITQGLPRVEELFEARKKTKDPEGIFSKVKGTVVDISQDEPKKIYVQDELGSIHEYVVPSRVRINVTVGQKVLPGQSLTSGSLKVRRILEELGVEDTATYLLKEIKKVYVQQGVDIHDKHFELIIKQMLNKVEVIESGDTDFLPGDLVPIALINKVNKEIMENNAKIELNRKRLIEKTIARHILIKNEEGIVEEIAKEGDEVTEELLEKLINFGVKEVVVLNHDKEKEVYQILPKETAKYRRKLLRITQASLEYEGWLSAASFQQTQQVLTDAAIKGALDTLRGLKENVIVGQLIPAGTGFEIFANVQYEETPRHAKEEKEKLA
ncbi:DNA-directed RNA polymerase subunit beta' [Fervidobacterium gondwanense]|uniref:DNA-directed RNA polymerase subunit beta' n=1 Tax=Fervidobacterium gondwanense DSM 13020 TaxID=1121883 RepID=A0A1M7RW63_FERGO|nr:DNA-directed RNA polymerase subunit beta' [Fervidobacterium gondwanense]SHN50401.1 DNA-directed RNA polymerase subunit beta' [Fervidobacterium gondwanense DSM 13020]